MRFNINSKYAFASLCYGITITLFTGFLMTDAAAATTESVDVITAEEAKADPGTNSTGDSSQPEATITQSCILAKQLKADFFTRADYEGVIAANRSNSTDWNGRYDPISMECISCHDGTIARGVKNKMSMKSLISERSIATVSGSHPIGMDYEKYRGNREYVSAEFLPAGMVLMGGRVGCVTCHNLLGSNRLYLVVDNAGSGLCFSCHNK